MGALHFDVVVAGAGSAGCVVASRLSEDPSCRVVLIEAVLPSTNQPGMGPIMDLEMLVMPGGRERTEREFRELFDKSGFTLTRIVPTQAPLWVIEARPK